MTGALRTLGAVEAMTTDPEGRVTVTVRGGGSADAARLPGVGDETLDCGNAGTAMRLLAGALAGRPARATLVGDASLSARPMERVAEPLRRTGATVETTDGHAPIRIAGRRPLTALEHRVPVASAQVIGCLALAGLAADGTTTITVPGPTRDHTERMLAWLGAPVRRDGLMTIVDGPAGFSARDIRVPGDISSAAAWLVAGALHPRAEIRLEGVGLNPSRIGIIEVLREMGADIEVEPADGAADHPEPVGDILVRGGRPLHAIDLGGHRVADVIDELPLIGVAMAAADGRSELRDAAELRVKELDRIALVTGALADIGARVEERPDGWVVSRGTPREAAIRTEGRPPHRHGLRHRRPHRCGGHRPHRRPSLRRRLVSRLLGRPGGPVPMTLRRLRLLTAGESHGPGLSGILDGLPAGLRVSTAAVDAELARRQHGYGSGRRMRIEQDRVTWTAGLRYGRTLGSPLAFSIANRDWADWQERMAVEAIPSRAARSPSRWRGPAMPTSRGPSSTTPTTSATCWSAPRLARPLHVSRPARCAASSSPPATSASGRSSISSVRSAPSTGRRTRSGLSQTAGSSRTAATPAPCAAPTLPRRPP